MYACPTCKQAYRHIGHPLRAGVIMMSLCACTDPGSYMKHKGLHQHRLKDNKEERRFARAWDTSNEQSKFLAHLMSEDQRPAEVSKRDILVAATVIQWLGSPVGQHWLEELGYKKEGK